MNNDPGELYRITKKDIAKTGIILAEAFRNDPIFEAIFHGKRSKHIDSFFEGAARFGIRYGQALAPSEALEGVAVWVPGDQADMTAWRTLITGAAFASLGLGIRLLKNMEVIFSPLEKNRRRLMKGRDYIYLMAIAVAPEYQGQGMGKRLLTQLFRESEEAALPIFLETATEKNVRMYEHLGFKLIDTVIQPIINLPHHGMLREPK